MNGVIGLGGTLFILLALGGLLGLADRGRFAPRWLLAAALLVAINDALLTRVYGLLPDLIGGERNWQGKMLALAATLAIAAVIGWREVGVTLVQEPGSLRRALPVLALYCALFAALAFAFPSEPASGEEIAFQLTMPGLEEEAFYRGLLLYSLYRAFAGRVRLLGVDWGWGAILSCLLFGLVHAFGYSDGGFSLDPLALALTGLPAFVGVWLRLRTGSLLLPVVMHNFGNLIFLLI
ncbi:CPBP family intramembrane metalloprotease [Sphingomonas parva]|uniref:CPBP family intramembrane metalloprotease n=1 Tax=Sphingomonas parva TaxID=2555898 RepID=A0A4Y8ZSJ6_9SPHN|nr:CPBP family intramembrane glutamic endopeptidase [Sphingomonas parva]TFI57416.1 CPBP family intramembrane metalloprotease [Sphingomonas parva]